MKNQSGGGVFIPFALSQEPPDEGRADSSAACVGGSAAAISIGTDFTDGRKPLES
jgi:hypothetical protein